jgi:hypothetical protein
VLTGSKRWRLIPARANGQLAFGAYAWDEKAQAFVADAVKVVGLRGTQIKEITAFRTPDALHGLGLPDTIPAHWQSQRPGSFACGSPDRTAARRSASMAL